MLLLGCLAGKPMLDAPGDARSRQENRFDWVLQRLLAGRPVTAADLRRIGVGGLLMEIVSRPQPRSVSVAALVLAAGRSARYRAAGGQAPSKLVELFVGEPLVRHAVRAALGSWVAPVVVVTGYAATEVRAALHGLPVRFTHNADFATGLASSLRTGLAAIDDTASAALVLLGDMPLVTPALIDALVAAWAANPGANAAVPVTAGGERGNPVLLARSIFAAAGRLTGDEGARRLLRDPTVNVVDVRVSGAATRLDIDEPAGFTEGR